MATVQIGGREFRVFDRKAPGGLGRTKRIVFAEKALKESKPENAADAWAELVRCYLCEEVSADELLELLPDVPIEEVRACIVASGGTVAAPGEAKAP